MWMLLACTTPPDGETASRLLDEASLDGCVYAAETTSGDGTWVASITGSYDAEGRGDTFDATTAEGSTWRTLSRYDASGCLYQSHWDVVLPADDFQYRDRRELRCDGHMNWTYDAGVETQADADGTIYSVIPHVYVSTNTYEGDLLVGRESEGLLAESDFSWDETWTYDEDERLTEYDDGASVYTYYYDETGNLIEELYYGGGPHSEGSTRRSTSFLHDGLGRVTEAVEVGNRTGSAYSFTTTYTWEGDTLRMASEDRDDDSDGVTDERDTYSWDCP
jgi:YD repeat-containing protein